MKHGFKTWAEKQAIYWRKELNLSAWQRLPADVLARKLEVKIMGPLEIEGISPAQLKLMLETRSDEWSATTLVAKDGTTVLLENTSHSDGRQEATRFHELAHLICKHECSGIRIIDGGFPLRKFDKEQEDEADWLGHCLHLPAPLLHWCLNRGYTTAQIAEHCTASTQLVTYRLNKTGVNIIRSRMAR